VGGLNLSGLSQEKININPLVQYINDGAQDVRGVYGGSFSIDLILGGETTDTSSTTTTVSDLAALLGHCIGNSAFAASAGDTATGATDADTIPTTGASGWNAGALAKVGALGDGDGEGQFYAVTSHGSNAMELLNAMPGATAAAAVLYSPAMVYPNADPSGDAQSMRFRLLTSNKQYECRGVWCQSVSFSGLSPGELPKVSMTFGVAYFNEINVTFPATESVSADPGKPCAAGSLFYQTVGTTTRNTHSPVSFELSLNMSRYPVTGPGGNYDRQIITCVRDGMTKASISATFDAEAVGTQTFADEWDTDEESAVFKHLLYTVNQDVAFYFPKIKMVGARPIQSDVGGLNRVAVQWEAVTGPTTTSDLTLSNFRLAMA